MTDPTLTVAYGDDNQHRVEFRLDPHDPAVVMGRYLADAHGFTRTTAWEARPPDYSDPAHVAIIAALREVLTQYATPDAITTLASAKGVTPA